MQIELHPNQIPLDLKKYFRPKRKYGPWILRNNIVWRKPNAMPCSVKDRFTVDFEMIMFFVANKKYWFETQYEPHKEIDRRTKQGLTRVEYNGKSENKQEGDGVGTWLGQSLQGRNKRAVWTIQDRQTPYAVIEPEFRKEIIDFRDLPEHDAIRLYLTEWKNKKEITIEQIESYFGNQAGHHWFEKDGSYPSKDTWLKLKELLGFDETFDECMTEIFQKSGLKQNSPEGRLMRTTWTITTQPFKEAHFATFPEDLVIPMIKAGCPEFVCKKCGKPREKIIESLSDKDYSNNSNYKRQIPVEAGLSKFNRNSEKMETTSKEFKGYSDCGCNVGFSAGIVLDPFAGSGTTLKVARDLHRNSIGIELNKDYVEIIKKRLYGGNQPLINEFEVIKND